MQKLVFMHCVILNTYIHTIYVRKYIYKHYICTYTEIYIYIHTERVCICTEREFKNQIFSPVLRAPFEDNKI